MDSKAKSVTRWVVILTGIGLPDDRLHAPNEKLDLKQLWDGIEVFRRFYELLGSLESGVGADFPTAGS